MLYSERLRRRDEYYRRPRPGGEEPPLHDFRAKLRSRLVARGLGLRVPELYWVGAGRLPLHLLPPRVVVKPTRGSYSRGVRLIDGGHDHMAGRPLDVPSLLAAARAEPFLAEAFVPCPDGAYRVPVDYKVFAFGGRVAAVQAIDRTRQMTAWFDPGWAPRPPVSRSKLMLGQPGWFPRPGDLAGMLAAAAAVGRRAGSFVRVDLYDSPAGPVFGETAVVPNGGAGVQPDADREFGGLWAAECGDAF